MKWKQAIGYFFTHNSVATSNLASYITECVQKAEQCGVHVRCVVCDQGPTNIAALRQLGFEEESPCITGNNVHNKVFVIFDPPHLIKNVRNNLQ